MLWWGCFEIPTPKTLENMHKNVFSAVLIPDWKFLGRYFTGSAQKRRYILRFRNFAEAFTNVRLFLLGYKPEKQNSQSWSREICASWKRMLGINEKLYFPLKNIYLYNLYDI